MIRKLAKPYNYEGKEYLELNLGLEDTAKKKNPDLLGARPSGSVVHTVTYCIREQDISQGKY